MRRFVFTLSMLAIAVIAVRAQDAKDSEKAAATKKALQTKITVDYKDDLLQNVIKDIADKVKEGTKQEVQIKIDPTGAASNNMKVTYGAKDKPAIEVLGEMTKKHDLGFMIISGKYKAFGVKYDGFVFITK